MSKLLDTLGAWYIVKTAVWMTVGESVIKPLVRKYVTPFLHAVIEDVSEWPRVAHRLEGHDAKWSTHCDQCRLGTPNNVDTLS